MVGGVQRVAVIGGGIGGLCVAIALRRLGLEVTVFEQAEALGEVGAGLTVWANAIKALRKLGVADEVVSAGSRIQRAEIRTARGSVLSVSRPEHFERLSGELTVAIHRADLHSILRAPLPPSAIRLGARLSGFEQGQGGVTIRFASGTADSADLVIGADGLKSVVRRQLFPGSPRYAGYTAWRGVTAVGERLKVGHTSESWGRGARFGIVPIGGERVYWYATANAPAGEDDGGPERKAILLRTFEDWHAPIPELIQSTPQDAILHNDVYDVEPMESWHDDRVVLLGDAAHPTTPNMGQGACMAIESAVVLARCLASARDLPSALYQYQVERMPRTSWVTRQSRTIGQVGQMQGKLACALRNLALLVTPDAMMRRTLKRLVCYDA